MIEHWGKCKKTLEKLERRNANKLEVKRAEIAHDEAFGDATRCMFILISVISDILQYRILLDLFDRESTSVLEVQSHPTHARVPP